MSTRFQRRVGFTIVELLVVIGIIALLLAVLLPALGGVRRKSLKADEINSIRQVGIAWNVYAQNNQDSCLPGYIDPELQIEESWNVVYEYKNGDAIPFNDAAPWTWRLMGLVDYSHDIVHGHLDEPGVDLLDFSTPEGIEESAEIAFEPAFGYNGLYFGGWWEVWFDPTDPENNLRKGKPRYSNYINNDGESVSLSAVVRSVGRITRSANVVIFCSSTEVEPGIYKGWPDHRPGSHLIVPPFECQTAQWGWPAGNGAGGNLRTTATAASGDFWTVEAFVPTSVPIGRYTKNAALVFADGHTGSESPNSELMRNMRTWVDEATSANYRHECNGP